MKKEDSNRFRALRKGLNPTLVYGPQGIPFDARRSSRSDSRRSAPASARFPSVMENTNNWRPDEGSRTFQYCRLRAALSPELEHPARCITKAATTRNS
jgi:hypothetical protein